VATLASWLTAAPAALSVIALVVVFRWLLSLQRRSADHAERIAHLEGENDRLDP
jgi:hypothetical protein